MVQKFVKILTVHASDVLHGDFAVSPYGRDHEVELLAPQAAEGRAQVLAVNAETEDTFVHVKHNWKRERAFNYRGSRWKFSDKLSDYGRSQRHLSVMSGTTGREEAILISYTEEVHGFNGQRK